MIKSLLAVHAVPARPYLIKWLAHKILPCSGNDLMEWVWCWHHVFKLKDMKAHNKNRYRLADFLFVLTAWLTAISLVYILIIRLQ